MWRKLFGLVLTGLMTKYWCPFLISVNVAFSISENKNGTIFFFLLRQYHFQDSKNMLGIEIPLIKHMQSRLKNTPCLVLFEYNIWDIIKILFNSLA